MVFRSSITKKQAYSLILAAKKVLSKPNQKTHTIKKTLRGNELSYTYNKVSEKITRKNFLVSEDLKILMESYLQIIFNKNKKSYIFGHLAQTLDGFIATMTGESKYISSYNNLEHLHMLRAISDVVLVGSNTVKLDNPKLTTRLVSGPNPMRVVIDSKNVISNSCHLLSNKDIKGFKIISDNFKLRSDYTLKLPTKDGKFKISNIISLLENMNKNIIFIEGGGKIISNFYKNKKLDRLHLCISPILIGEGINSIILSKEININKKQFKKITYMKMYEDIVCNIDLSF